MVIKRQNCQEPIEPSSVVTIKHEGAWRLGLWPAANTTIKLANAVELREEGIQRGDQIEGEVVEEGAQHWRQPLGPPGQHRFRSTVQCTWLG